MPLKVNFDEDRAQGKCVYFQKILASRQEDFLSDVVTHTLTPVGNKGAYVLTLTKKTQKTAPLSVLFTSVD